MDAATATMSANDLYANDPNDVVGWSDTTGSSGNVSVDPAFNDTSMVDYLAWDLHLSTNSTLVDGGGSDNQNHDPDGSTNDLGAYGGPGADSWDLDDDGTPEWWFPGAYDSTTYPGQGWDCDDLDDSVYPGNGC